MRFEQAMVMMRQGERMRRTSWGCKTLRVWIGVGRVYIFAEGGKRMMWEPRQRDIMAEDWVPYHAVKSLK